MSSYPVPPELWKGWVCPNCGQTEQRHGRGGARACHAEAEDRCPGLECKCEDGQCYSKTLGFGWRRSPCLNAVCAHCGWTGTIRSRAFERRYANARCPKSTSGWHWVTVEVDLSQFEPAGMTIKTRCVECGATGIGVLDPVTQMRWTRHQAAEDKSK